MVLGAAGCQVKPLPPAPLAAADPNKPVNPGGIAADSPAHLASSESRLYLQFDNMAQWRAARERDPLVEYLWQGIAEMRPKGMWDEAIKTLGLDEDGLTDRYFGHCLAIVGETGSTSAPYVIISRVAPAYLAQLPMALSLKPLGVTASAGGTGHAAGPGMPPLVAPPFGVFTSKDGQLLFALHDRWLIAAPARHRGYFDGAVLFAASRVVPASTSNSAAAAAASPAAKKPGALSMVEDDDFQKSICKVPGERTLLLYTRDKDRKGRHAVSVAMDGAKLVARYAGTIDKIDELYEQFDHGNEVDFGFVPASAISAASVNLMKKDSKGIAALNLFLFPHNIQDDVLPKLSAPIIVFLDKIDGAKIKPNPGVSVPAVGVAIRMNDASVAHDLDRIVGGLRFLANVGELDVIGGVFGGKEVESDGLRYRIADFGKTLVKQIKDAETARMFKLPDAAGLTHLTYGRLGQWYVVCTQEALYKECAAAYAKKELQLGQSPAFATFPFQMREGLLISGLTRAPELAALTRELSGYWEKMEEKARKEAGLPAPKDPDAPDAPGSGARKIRRPMEWIANAVKHRDSFYVQVWRDKEGDLLGHLSTVDPVKGPAPAPEQ
jgi:hypothetical protein